VEETWIPLLGVGRTVDRKVNLLVVVVKHGQSVLGLEGVHEVLCGLVEVPSARPDTPAAVQHVTPVGTAETGVVVLIVRVLYSKDALLGVLILRQENVAKVLKIAIL
jgi:hypothetical protein